MITYRAADERGHTGTDWLDSRHSFSFGDYFDPAHLGFRSLRVINEDRIAPGGGFPTHGHRDMEIITYVLEGALAHKDSLGNGSVIRPGDVQRMSAGTGILHSEFNAADGAETHLLQIWVVPQKRGLQPGYEQRHFACGDMQGRLRLVADPAGHEGAVTIHQDAQLYAAVLAPGQSIVHALGRRRAAYLHVARGTVALDGKSLGPGDAAAIEGEDRLAVSAADEAEILLFDLA